MTKSHTSPEDLLPPTKERILDRAEVLLSEANLEQLLGFLTPERLADGADFSPAAVRYNFSQEGRRFDRPALASALLERFVAAYGEAAKSAIEVYRYASIAVSNFADADRVVEGVLGDVERYYGPALEQEPAAAARERLYLLALLTAERQPESARALADSDERILAEYAEVYDLYLEKTNRRLAAGLTSMDLANLISYLLIGATLVGRYSSDIDMETVARAVIRVFWAFTYDPETQGQPSYESEIGVQ